MTEIEEARAAPQTDPWIRAAMFDSSLVAEILLRLPLAAVAVDPAPLPPLRWGLRQPRSRQILRAGVLQSKKEDCNEDEVARGGSPTTPLSWSGGSSSPSGSRGEAYVESSRFGNPVAVSRNSFDCGRSKVAASSEATPSSRLATGRSRKRKTFTQLKEEENLLLEERTELNKKLEGLHVARNELTVKNENLKKLKMNLESQTPDETRTSDSTPAKGFVLPDLNLPPEDESASEVLYGMS